MQQPDSMHNDIVEVHHASCACALCAPFGLTIIGIVLDFAVIAYAAMHTLMIAG
jgi:hypothetical protein